jgi:hypothetical protein
MHLTEDLVHEEHKFDGLYRIRHVDQNAGFSAIVTYALNGVRRALDRNLRPIIDYTNHDVNSFFYQPEMGDNVWSYYFEPIMGLDADILKTTASPVLTEEPGELLRDHQRTPERLATFWADEEPDDKPRWKDEKRALGRAYVNKFLRVKPHILHKVDQFASDTFQGLNICGIHIRGTDLDYATPVPLSKYLEAAAHYLRSGYDALFVATDQEQFLDTFQEVFGPDRVFSLPALRSDSVVPAFKRQEGTPYRRGEEVLIDILLLSRCQFLIKGPAAVGEFATWFNPDLECLDFGLQSQFDCSNVAPAFNTLNVGNQAWLPWKIRQVRYSVYRVFRQTKRKVLDKIIGQAKKLLPKPLREFLWQHIGRHVYS